MSSVDKLFYAVSQCGAIWYVFTWFKRLNFILVDFSPLWLLAIKFFPGLKIFHSIFCRLLSLFSSQGEKVVSIVMWKNCLGSVTYQLGSRFLGGGSWSTVVFKTNMVKCTLTYINRTTSCGSSWSFLVGG